MIQANNFTEKYEIQLASFYCLNEDGLKPKFYAATSL